MVRTYAIWDSSKKRLTGKIYISKKEAAEDLQGRLQSVVEVIRKPNAPLLKKEDILFIV